MKCLTNERFSMVLEDKSCLMLFTVLLQVVKINLSNFALSVALLILIMRLVSGLV